MNIGTKEASELLDVSRQRLWQLRNGYNNRGYFIKPRLKENKHWHWERGEILYNKENLLNYKKEMESVQS